MERRVRPGRPRPPRPLIWLLAVCALGLSPGGTARADPAPVVFCFNAWPPYAFRQDDAIAGVSIEIMQAAARRAGYAPDFVELPWNRCIQSVEAGTVHAALDAARRDNLLQGPESYSAYTNTFWVRPDSPIRAATPEAFRGLRLGLVSGYEYPASLLAAATANGMTVDYSVDDGANVRKLVFGRVDVIVADRISTRWMLRQEGIELRPLSPDHSADTLYPSFNPAFHERHRRIDAALADMRQTGEIDAVIRKYVGKTEDEGRIETN